MIIYRSKVVCPRGDWQVINIRGEHFSIVSECRVTAPNAQQESLSVEDQPHARQQVRGEGGK